jgi:hypothetical protein
MSENSENPIVDSENPESNTETTGTASNESAVENNIEATEATETIEAVETSTEEVITNSSEAIVEATPEAVVETTPEAIVEATPVAVVESTVAAEEPVQSVEEVVADVPELEHTHEDGVKLEELEQRENYFALSQKELLERLQNILASTDFYSKKLNVREIREAYRNHQRDTYNANLLKFKEDGGDPNEFEAPENPLDEKFNEHIKQFNGKVAEENKRKERELQNNLKSKLQLIAEVKAIVDAAAGAEALDQIHEIQAKWRAVGLVPASETEVTWKNFNHHINRFFDGLKFMKELRELDYKRNLELKTALCERAEKLIIEPTIKAAIEGVRSLMEEWKEIGPTSKETNEVIWQRFTSAMDNVYARQKEYLDKRKAEFDVNLAKKRELVEKMRPIADFESDRNTEWKDKTTEAEAIMNEWKQVGFAAKADNDAIWEEFKGLRDKFYKSRNAHFDKIHAMFMHNQKAKTELCEQVERLKESTNWRETSNAIKKLQEEWKQIGPVPQKLSEKLWKRFRSACDVFYDNMKLHFEESDKKNAENLAAKEELIKRVEAFELLEDNNETIEKLKAFQTEWMGIGHVPMKEKDRVNTAYKKAIDAHFEKVRSRVGEQNKNTFRARYTAPTQNNNAGGSNAQNKLRDDKFKLQDRIKKIQAEIAQQENNLSFFAKSKNADMVLKEVKGRIDAAHNEVRKLKDQIKIIDEIRAEQENKNAAPTAPVAPEAPAADNNSEGNN